MKKSRTYGTKDDFMYAIDGLKAHPQQTTIYVSKDGKLFVEFFGTDHNMYIWQEHVIGNKCFQNAGYQMVHIGGKSQLIHRLVAETWVKCPSSTKGQKYEVDHINGDKTDNSADNLRWVTHKENMANATWGAPTYKFRYSFKNEALLFADGHSEKMSYADYLIWRKKHGYVVKKYMYERIYKEV